MDTFHTFQWIVPIPHGPPDLTMTQSTRATQHRPKVLLCLCGTGWPRVYCTCTAWVGWRCIVPYHTGGPAGCAILYLYCTGWLRAMTHSSPYHIYHLPIWVIHLNTFDMELTIYVWDSFFNVNSTVMFVSWLDYLIWQLSWEHWYGAYHICLGLIFQCEFNGDVCFVIGLPYLAIISGMLV
jgi:hypothetical protein